MSQRTTRLTIDIPATEHRKLKMAASLMNISMKQLVMMSVDEFMQKKFNNVAEKVLEQSKAGKNVKKFDSLDDLFERLGTQSDLFQK